MNFHTQSVQELLQQLQTDSSGLKSKEAQERIAQYGINTLPSKPEPTPIEHFIRQFKNPIVTILLAAALLSLVIKEYHDAGFILIVLLLNALISAYQEYTSEQKAKLLQNLIQTKATALRDGKKTVIDSTYIVPGDILLLESGTKVSADIRLLSSHRLLVDESLLTGESLESLKEATFTSNDENLLLAKRHNMLFAGTYVTGGRGMGLVVATGAHTQAGKIATLIAKESQAKIPLLEKMEKLTFTISLFMLATIAILFVVGILKGMGFYTLLLFSVALAVSAIPEGLLVAITVALSSASMAMSKRHVIVRKLAAIEGLGACTLIASDKTGTLTQNHLSVEYFISPTRTYDALTFNEAHDKVYLASILCNEMHFNKAEEKLEFFGDQVDIALAQFAANADESYLASAKSYQKIDEIPYEPVNRFSAVMMKLGDEILQFSKGSPETVLEHCTLSNHAKQQILSSVDEWTMKGYRTIALAYKETKDERHIDLRDFTYLGFVAIIDPMREEAPDAVKKAQHAGIKVVMITGDHPNTALCISKKLGIATAPDQVMSEKALIAWEENGFHAEEISNKTVFSRVTPSQKMKIVQAFQSLGHYVAVTGDGVNDAPALRHANIGVAMGKSGTDIAKSSGDIIITDDNFSSIINGIEEGRRAHDNIRKVIYLLITTGFAEIVLVMLSFIAGLPLPLLPVQLLWLNLASNGVEDVVLGLEKAEPGLLNRQPRPPKEPIFNALMLRRIVVGGLYIAIVSFTLFYLLLESGISEYSARNIVLLMMVLFENIHIFNARTETNYLHKISYRHSAFLIIWVILTQLLHLWAMHTPFMQSILSVEPVSLEMWSLLLLFALGLIIVMEIDKWIQFRNMKNIGVTDERH